MRARALLWVPALLSCTPTTSRPDVTDAHPTPTVTVTDASGDGCAPAAPVEVRIGTRGDGSAAPQLPRTTRAIRVVLDAPYQSWAGDGTWVHLVAYRPTMRPCEGAKVYLANRQIGVADAHGVLVFRKPAVADEPEGGRVLVTCEHEGATRAALVHYNAFRRESSFETPTVYVHTDRGIYNPGQTIHLRALAWKLRGDWHALPEQHVDVSLRGSDRLVVGGTRLTTDAYGVGAGDVAISSRLPEGRYTLVASLNGATAEAEVIVQRFVAPAVDIQHTLGEFLTPSMTSLPFTVSLRMFDGAPFTRGRVEVSLRREGRVTPVTARDVIGAGPHSFTIPGGALDALRRDLAEDDVVECEVAVTDPAGRRDFVRRGLRFTRMPYRAALELDRQEYAEGERVDATVRIVDLNNVVVRNKPVRLTGLAAVQRGVTDADGIVHFRFAMPAHEVSLAAYVDDASAPIAQAMARVGRVHPMQSQMTETRVREREPVNVTVRFPANVAPWEDVVHADVVDSSGAIIDSHLFPIDRTGPEPVARGRFIAPSWGSMLLTLYTTAAPKDHPDAAHVGLVTDGQNVPVAPGVTLEVTLRDVPEEARPGATLNPRVEVRRDGHPVDAELGIAVVDRAVISLKDPLEHTPMDRFYNPELKVLASTGAQTLTWPVVQRNWGNGRYDIGWPASFGFHEGAAFVDPDPDAALPEGADGVNHMGIFAALTDTSGTMTGDAIGDAFGYGGLGESGTGWGGGGTGEGTIGLGNLGTIGHGAGTGSGQGYGSGAGRGLRSRSSSVAAEPDPRLPQAPRVVIRTDFHETSLWAPQQFAAHGDGRFALTLPDDITEQEIDVVASDRNGGVGMARMRVPVRQAMYVRSDLPPVMVQGDEAVVAVAARNLSAAPVTAQLSLSARDLDVAAVDPESVTVAPQEIAARRFRVVARAPGEVTYDVHGQGAGIDDTSHRTLTVLPPGVPRVREETAPMRRGTAARFDITREPGRPSHATLAVRMPATAGLVEALHALHERGAACVDDVSWGLDVSLSLLRLPDAVFPPAGKARVRAEVDAEMGAWIAARNPDGGFAWWWRDGSDVAATTHALEVFGRAHEVGVALPLRLASRAAEWLVAQLGRPPSTWSRAIARWEGDGPRVRDALFAEAVAAIASLPPDARSEAVQSALVRWHAPMERIARDATDPLVMAHAARALLRMGARESLPSLGERLLRARSDRHWEPGWFDAFGGAVETTAVALDVLRETDPTRYEAVSHESAAWLLATREAWGGWHDERGTAFAIDALSHMALTAEQPGAAVVVRVDGREVSRTLVGVDDPWASTLALRRIDLDRFLSDGRHAVEVTYDGALSPDVTLRRETWGEATDVAVDGLVRVALPGASHAGAAASATVTVTRGARTSALHVDVAMPPDVEVDGPSLDALVARHELAGWDRATDTLSLHVDAPAATVVVPLTLRPRRVGLFHLRDARLRTDRGVVRVPLSAALRVTE